MKKVKKSLVIFQISSLQMKIYQVPNLFYSGHYGQNSKLQESLKCRIFAVLIGGFRLQAVGIRQKMYS